jgi:hypothetical protein
MSELKKDGTVKSLLEKWGIGLSSYFVKKVEGG